MRGYKLVCVMPEKMSEEKRQSLRALGAEVVITDNAPPGDPRHFQEVARRLAEERGAFLTDQFRNPANPRVHEETTGPELWAQCDGHIGAFVAGVGTGGTITGVGRYLKSRDPRVRVVLADPQGSRLAGLIREPDVMYLAGDRRGHITEEFWTHADLVVEVLSPGATNEVRDLVTKRREYADAKIAEYWIVDPEAQRITVLALATDGYEEGATLSRGEVLRAATLPGLTVDVSEIFDAE